MTFCRWASPLIWIQLWSDAKAKEKRYPPSLSVGIKAATCFQEASVKVSIRKLSLIVAEVIRCLRVNAEFWRESFEHGFSSGHGGISPRQLPFSHDLGKRLKSPHSIVLTSTWTPHSYGFNLGKRNSRSTGKVGFFCECCNFRECKNSVAPYWGPLMLQRALSVHRAT